MSSLPNIDQPASKAEHVNRHDANLNTASQSVHKRDMTSESRSTPDRIPPLTPPATRFASYQPSEGSESTKLCTLPDDRAYDDASSVTFQDEFPWHQVGLNRCSQKIPSMIVPALLQGFRNVSPSRSPLDELEDIFREADEYSSNPGDGVPRYSATQKGKWKAQTDGEVMQSSRGVVRPPSPQFQFGSIFDTAENWVMHTRPILQDYADRQPSLPLGRRLEVTIDEPPMFILGAVQLLVNRDQKGCAGRSGRLGPQLIENFVDIDRWAKEYFRSRHDLQVVDSDVPALLTIVINNFYEGQVQLIDRLVEFALENMHFCGRSSLNVEDFAFGFDFKMSQDLPFYVETSSQIREPLPIPAVEVRPTTPEPVITQSGRQVKPTERAQAASQQAQANVNGRRNKGNNSSQLKDKETTKSSVPARQKKSSTQPSAQRTVKEIPVPSHAESDMATPDPPKTTSGRTKPRPTRPSNLGLPPILPISSSTPGITSLHPDDSSKPDPSASGAADSPKGSGSEGVNPAIDPPLHLKIRLPAPSLPTSTVSATRGSESTISKTSSPTAQTNPSADAAETTKKEREARRPGAARPRGPRNGRERESASVTPSTRGSSTALLHAADHSTGTGGGDPSTSQTTPTSGPLPPLAADPGHPQRKKRKLEDCDD
ncbi:hypothetical protein EV363DRAFT_1227624 [Boletus edulis]|nr:hypothetical protein EV363DRAFT_1227624 [Boletus edulis]